MTYEILKNVPMPRRVSRKFGTSKYKFNLMEVKDCFFFKEEELKKISTTSSMYGKKHNKRFSIRRLKDGRYGIWRVA